MADRAAGLPAAATTAADYPQAWIELGAHALYVYDPESENPGDELEGCRSLAEMVLDAVIPEARPVIAAEAARQERQRIRELAIDQAEKYDDVFEAPGALRRLADLLREDAP